MLLHANHSFKRKTCYTIVWRLGSVARFVTECSLTAASAPGDGLIVLSINPSSIYSRLLYLSIHNVQRHRIVYVIPRINILDTENPEQPEVQCDILGKDGLVSKLQIEMFSNFNFILIQPLIAKENHKRTQIKSISL